MRRQSIDTPPADDANNSRELRFETENTPLSHPEPATLLCCSFRSSALARVSKMLNHQRILLIMTAVGVVAGLITGYIVSISNPSDDLLKILELPGMMLLRALNCVLVPLIVSSMISAMASLGNVVHAGKIGLRTLAYYFTTTFCAVILGLVLVNIIEPGSKGSIEYHGEPVKPKCEGGQTDGIEPILNIVRNLIPTNLFDASSAEIDCGVNILGLIVFSLIFGGIISTMGDKGKPLKDFFEALNEAIMKMVMLIIWYAPFGIMFLIIWRLGREANFWGVLAQLGWYVLTVILGLVVHMLIVVPLFYFVLVRKNPYKYLAGMTQVLLTAFGTSSSSATIPLTINCCETNLGVSSRTARFVIPLGATVNMDGTALYEAVACLFVAQALGVKLSIGQNIIVALTATLASIGAAGIPEAGLITLVMVVQSVGLPQEGIGMILAVDWFLDRLRTVTNVFGDSVGAAIVDTYERKDLAAAASAPTEDEDDNDTELRGASELPNATTSAGESTTIAVVTTKQSPPPSLHSRVAHSQSDEAAFHQPQAFQRSSRSQSHPHLSSASSLANVDSHTSLLD